MPVLFLFSLLLVSGNLMGQSTEIDWENRPWLAQWIDDPGSSSLEFGVYHFRRTFDLAEVPATMPVHVSADNRYQLYVNGEWIGEGPSRADLLHWRYETYDLAEHLKAGTNVIAAVVWNYGAQRAWFQQSLRTAFLMQPVTEEFGHLATDENWKVFRNPSYSPITNSRERLGVYIVTGPQLRFSAPDYPWGWETLPFNDGDWSAARPLLKANPAGTGTEFYWCLVPREIPPLERIQLPPLDRIDREGKRSSWSSIEVPAGTRDTFLLTPGFLTNAYFAATFRGGTGAKVQLHYAESLFEDNGTKGDRAATKGKQMLGVYDELVLDGGERTFTTLTFRTGRYLQLVVETSAEPLRILNVTATEVAYPFTANGGFHAEADEDLKEIWDIGWRTARMCAQETYVDCPYYEQLQYVGDTRIQALISLYVSGDDRLMRKAIQEYDESRIAEGLTMSRYPTQNGQIIPPYSLAWVEMVGDYWWHRPDEDFVRDRLDGVIAVLGWFERHELPNGLLGNMPFWNFVDWTDKWPWDETFRIGGVPDLEGGTSIISLQYAGALATAGKLFAHFGDKRRASTYARKSAAVVAAVRRECYQSGKGLLSDTPKGESFSQHANILGLLYGVFTPRETDRILQSLREDDSLVPASIYFRFYLMQALYATGRQSEYLRELGTWKELLEMNFTTWPEIPGPAARSDCHAWSAAPNYDLPATLAGIRPSAPGFGAVNIRPAAVDLEYVTTVAHPDGLIKMEYSAREVKVTLPPGLPGLLELDGKKHRLSAAARENTWSFTRR